MCEPARDTSGGFSQRPGPPRRPPKEAGDIISSYNLRRRLYTTRTETDPRAAGGWAEGRGYTPQDPYGAVRHASGGFRDWHGRPRMGPWITVHGRHRVGGVTRPLPTAMRWRRRGVEAGNGCTGWRVWPGGRAHGDDSVAKRACGHKPFSFTALVAGCRGGRREGRSPPCEVARGRPSHRWAGMMSSPPPAPFPAARRRCFHRRGLGGGGRRWFLPAASG